MKKVLSSLVITLSLLSMISFAQPISPTKKLLYYDAVHTFSNPAKKDHFMIYVIGKNIINGEVNFEIWNYKGQNIYHQKMYTADLLPKHGKHKLSIQQQNIIISQLSTFFDDHNFFAPAIESNEKFDYDEENTSNAAWHDIKIDRTAVGFLYSWKNESSYNIAYSKKKHKVVTYLFTH